MKSGYQLAAVFLSCHELAWIVFGECRPLVLSHFKLGDKERGYFHFMYRYFIGINFQSLAAIVSLIVSRWLLQRLFCAHHE